MKFADLLCTAGVAEGDELMLHISFRAVKMAFPGITMDEVFFAFTELLTGSGSLVVPSFTYCFGKSDRSNDVFERERTPAKTGAFAEYLRAQPDITRTSSPTHSFLLWGKIRKSVRQDNNPSSPLGAGSITDILSRSPKSKVLLLGTDFTALTFLHFAENTAPLEYVKHSPWKHLGVTESGFSVRCETPLKEIPGCSKGFIRFQHYRESICINDFREFGGMKYSYLQADKLLESAYSYLKEYPAGLLCEEGTCTACDSRRPYTKEKKESTWTN